MAKDYRKSSLNTVTELYEDLNDWVDQVASKKLSASEMMIDDSDGCGWDTVKQKIKYLYNFARIGAMANVDGASETEFKLEKAMLQEEES